MKRPASKRWLFLAVITLAAATLVASPPPSPRPFSYATADGGTIHGDLYGSGSHAVVLAHGAVFDRKSWSTLAPKLAAEGFLVLAIDFRGYGESTPGSNGPRAYDEDVLGAVRAMRDAGATSVSVLGASMGGGASANAAVRAKPGEIDHLVLLSPVPIDHPESMHARSITYFASAGERLYPRVRAQYARAPEPKRFHVIEGDAHAQHIFETDQGKTLTRLILEALANETK